MSIWNNETWIQKIIIKDVLSEKRNVYYCSLVERVKYNFDIFHIFTMEK